jgi:hypothetical protein
MLMRAGFAQIELFQESHASWIRHTARREHRHKWARILRTRFGSSLASNWARMCGAAEAIIAVAKKTTDEHG